MPANNHCADHLLVSQCQAGNQAAWEQLYARLQERGEHLLPKALSQGAVNKALIEELIEETLTELFLKKSVLAAWYRSGDSLDKFLDKLLNRAVSRYYQIRARRRRREVLSYHS